MSCMKRLQEEIDNYAGEDTVFKEILTNEINQNVHGELSYNDMNNEAKYIVFSWEEQEKDAS